MSIRIDLAVDPLLRLLTSASFTLVCVILLYASGDPPPERSRPRSERCEASTSQNSVTNQRNSQISVKLGVGLFLADGALSRLQVKMDALQAAACGDTEWLRCILRRSTSLPKRNKQGLTVLHVAALHGRVKFMEVLLESGIIKVDARCPQGRTPLHLALTPKSSPWTQATVSCLLKHGAQVNAATAEGLTPLHQAATEGLLECVQVLMEAGANPQLEECNGHTPLDLAKLWCHRQVARYLKDAMWQKDKRVEVTQRKKLQKLKESLQFWHHRNECKEKFVRQDVSKERVTAWAKQKGVPLQWGPERGCWLRNHVRCTTKDPPATKLKENKGRPKAPREAWNVSPNPNNTPKASIGRPQEVRTSTRPQTAPSSPDLRRGVALTQEPSGHTFYKACWEDRPRPAPDLPLNVLKRELFPADFPSRLGSPLDFQSCSVLDLPRICPSPEQGASPWTEIAMHLVEELQPGHY